MCEEKILSENFYRCLCVPGVTGINCEINYCLANPCVHGQCFNEINGNGYQHGLRMPKETLFYQILNFLAWVDKLDRYILRYLGYFSQSISTHFGTVGPLSKFPLFNHYFYKKNQAFIFNTVKSRAVYYSILELVGQRSQYIIIKFPLHKPSENLKRCY